MNSLLKSIYSIRRGPESSSIWRLAPTLGVMDDFRTLLGQLLETLAASNGGYSASMVARALAGSDAELETFLRSNDLWGGAGSIADQGFIEGPSEVRLRGMRAMVALGNLQIERGVTNVRTEMWVRTFEKWLRDGVV